MSTIQDNWQNYFLVICPFSFVHKRKIFAMKIWWSWQSVFCWNTCSRVLFHIWETSSCDQRKHGWDVKDVLLSLEVMLKRVRVQDIILRLRFYWYAKGRQCAWETGTAVRSERQKVSVFNPVLSERAPVIQNKLLCQRSVKTVMDEGEGPSSICMMTWSSWFQDKRVELQTLIFRECLFNKKLFLFHTCTEEKKETCMNLCFYSRCFRIDSNGLFTVDILYAHYLFVLINKQKFALKCNAHVCGMSMRHMISIFDMI